MGKRAHVEVEAVDGRAGGREGPYVMYYPAGPPPTAGVRLHAYTKPGQAARPAGPPPQTQLVASADAVDYIGTNFGADTSASNCRYAVGVYDPAASTLKVVPLGGGQVFRMQPRVREVDYNPPAYTPPPPRSSNDDSRQDQIMRANKLAALFGRENLMRKRAERKVARIEEKHISGATVVQAGLEEAVEKEFNNADIYDRASEVRNIPPHNINATTPAAAYPFDQIITATEQTGLKELVVRLNKIIDSEHELQAAKDSAKYHPLVLQYTEEHFGKVKPGQRKQFVQSLAYLQSLLQLMKAPFVMKDKDLKAMNLPTALQQPLLEKFAETKPDAPAALNDISDEQPIFFEGEGKASRQLYQRPQEKRDLLLCYILLTCLVLNKYDVELSHLAREFQMQPKQLSLYFSELGCIVTRKGKAGEDEEGEKIVIKGSTQTRARLLLTDSRGKSLKELLPDRRPRPKKR